MGRLKLRMGIIAIMEDLETGHKAYLAGYNCCIPQQPLDETSGHHVVLQGHTHESQGPENENRAHWKGDAEGHHAHVSQPEMSSGQALQLMRRAY